ncbi:recombinase family protein [Brevibacillus parabrevis]|uniref:recombinase family protein n=1 Tax=Brevibacillus parabrevis TaxID=54914 RepID=UPI00285364AB|nr:recombinase family protein [Brevibacillus parabrevis]MDR4997861.1 recombinase family protein [Brevibacillus parabrevis]
MKVAIYLRVSTQEQVDNYSIEAQRERLEAFCKAKGWTIYDVYIDAGFTGSNIDRPGLQRLLNELDKFDGVVVYKLDRLSRSQRDTLMLIEDYFLKNKVDFVSLTEALDTSTPFGKAMIGILAVFAQLERETIAERMRLGHIKRAEEGLRVMGGDYDPAGYKRQDGSLVIVPEEAQHIQEAFNLYEQYHSITKVQKRLKELNYPVWRFRRYRDILSNKLYCGYVQFANKHYKGQHEPIISEEQFDRVQILLSRHKGRNAFKAKESLLSGLIFCGECGEPYTSYHCRSKGKHYRYYNCRARRFPSEYPNKCINKTWRSEALEKYIQAALYSMSDEKNSTEKEIVTVDYGAKMKKIDQKLERLIELYSDGSIDKSVLDKQVSKLNNEKRIISEQQNAQVERSARIVDRKQLQDYAIVLESTVFSDRQAIIQKLIHRLTIHKDRLEIEWNF